MLKTFLSFLIITLAVNGPVNGAPLSSQSLNSQSIFETNDKPTPFQEAVRSDVSVIASFMDIFDTALRGQEIQIEDIQKKLQSEIVITKAEKSDHDTVIIYFEKGGISAKATVKKRKDGEEIEGPGILLTDRHIIFIEKGKEDRNLQGKFATEADALIQGLIKDDKVIEISLDKKGRLNANRVVWVKEYASVYGYAQNYRGEEIDINQFFTAKEKENIEKWIKDKRKIASQVKFRITLSNPALGWTGHIEHSNIAHAGMRSGCIYTGLQLLKHIFSAENSDLREELLDKDEFRHIIGEGHGPEEDYNARLEMVNSALQVLSPAFQYVYSAMEKEDVYNLNAMIKESIEKSDEDNILSIFSVCNEFYLANPLYPVESLHPLKKAVALLSRENKEKLVDLITGKKSQDKGVDKYIAVNDILLMLPDIEKAKIALKDWIKNNAPELEGRTLWQISPEIWHESGGLARVMQYHGIGIKELIGEADVRFRQIEPHYQHRISASQKEESLDYTKDITHPLVSLEEVDRFNIMVGEREVEAIVSRGVNNLGIETYLIRDAGGFYVHSLYNYRNGNYSDTHLPTWEEFTVFFSKASLEFILRAEKKEKDNFGDKWKAPVLHTNDSQTGLIPVYRKIMLDELNNGNRREDMSDETISILCKMVIGFTTHTYKNRRTYDDGGHTDIDGLLQFMGIDGRYKDLFKHMGFGGKTVYDIASAALRTADWQGTVSRAHRDDVHIFDEWVNSTHVKWLSSFFRSLDIKVKEIAVSNGDSRRHTAEVFRGILKELFGDDVDVEHPTADQVHAAKKEAKKELKMETDKYFSTKSQEHMLDPDQIVIATSGRLVPDKVNITRSLTPENIKKLLKKGAQIVVYGNVQTKDADSKMLEIYFKDIIEEIKQEEASGEKYPGRLIFVPRFSQKEQRELLAATDMQIYDSNPGTEAAGYSEADISSCGGIVLAPYRDPNRVNNRVGEGLFEAQGLPLNFEKKGQGNTVVPKDWKPESYLEVFEKVLALYSPDAKKDKLKYYQETSVKLSRILEAILTAAAELREFNKAILEKKLRASIFKETRELEGKDSYKYVEGFSEYIKDNSNFLVKHALGADAKADKLFRIAVEDIEDIENKDTLCSFLSALQKTAKGNIELYSRENGFEVDEDIYRAFGISKEILPESLMEHRTRANTITVFSVEEDQVLPESGDKNRLWKEGLGGQPLNSTIVSPIRVDSGAAEIIRSIILGLWLSEIAENKYDEEHYVTDFVFYKYHKLFLSYGKHDDFDLTKEDFINMALGNVGDRVNSLNKFIKLMPSVPLDQEEIRRIYSNIHEVLTRA